MASPVAKLNRFSRYFSPPNFASFHNVKTSSDSSKLDSASDVPFPPDDFVGLVETPSTNRSPTLCSTPDLGSKRRSRLYKLFPSRASNPLHASDSSSPKWQANSNSKNCYSNKESSLRSRCFGVSDAVQTSEKKKQARISNKESDSRRCNVFSTSVVPNTSKKRKKINRLSGLTLSPTSVSWTSQSPFPFPNERKSDLSPSASFLYQSFDQNYDSADVIQLNCIEQCPPEKVYHWEENEDEIVVEENIGKGGFGHVFKGTYRGEKVAIKKILVSFQSRKVLVESFQGEICGLRLRHPNIVRSLVVIQGSPCNENKLHRNQCYVVMEHAGERNLSQVINNPAEVIDPERRNRFCSDILRGLAYLHQKKLAHLDLKPSNIIATASDTCKICDFGSCVSIVSPKDNETKVSQMTGSSYDSAVGSSLFSSHLSSSSSNKSGSHILGTFIYRAPELLRGFLPSFKADIFSFAITAWQIWSRTQPYEGQHYHTTVYGVVAMGLRPSVPIMVSEKAPHPIPEDISNTKFLEVLTCCWQTDPCKRPTADHVLSIVRACC